MRIKKQIPTYNRNCVGYWEAETWVWKCSNETMGDCKEYCMYSPKKETKKRLRFPSSMWIMQVIKR